MEKRIVNIISGSAGGTAAKGSVTYKISLPSTWVKEIGLDEKKAEISFDGETITIAPVLSASEFYNKKLELGNDIKIIEYYDREMLCTRIYADFSDKAIKAENFTEQIVKTAFGNKEHISWEDFEHFLEDRCISKYRDGLKEYLDALGLYEYDPMEIIGKTEGRMAEDEQWIKVVK